MNKNNENWVTNLYQRLDAVCQDIDGFVNKDTVLYVGNQMQNVGESVKKFYSDVVQDFVDPIQQAAHYIPSKCINLVETSISSLVGGKENTVDSNTKEPKEAHLLPKEICHKLSPTGLCSHSEQITSGIRGSPIGESETSDSQDVCSPRDKNLSKSFTNNGGIDEKGDDDYPAKISLESSENHLDKKSEGKGRHFYKISQSDDTAFEYSDLGIENIITQDLDIDKKILGEPLMNVEEKKTLLTGPSDEFGCDSNTSSIHQSSELESSITSNEIKEENASCIFAGSLLPEKLTDSSISSYGNSTVESDIIDSRYTETDDYFSLSSHGLSSCGSFTAPGFNSNNEASVSCSGFGEADGSTIDFEYAKMDTIDLSDQKELVESCVMVEGRDLFASPDLSRSKSYKKMIQDAFMSRKRLTKEYKQLAIWYGDIDKEFSQQTKNKLPDIGATEELPARDSADSDWELL